MIPIPFEYMTLKLIWWGLLGVLLMGFAVTEGFDFGLMLLSPLIARTDEEKRILINAIGPVWEGNQVWLVLGAGAIFAAFPIIYVVAFSGFYLAMLLALLGLVVRPVAIKFRSKEASPTWRRNWDIALFLSAFVPALIFGVALGNVVQGVPFQFDSDMRMTYTGTFWGLLNPYAVGTGLLLLSVFCMHGAAYARVKTTGALSDRAAECGRRFALLAGGLFVILGVSLRWLNGYKLLSSNIENGPANPLFKKVAIEKGAWMAHFIGCPLLWGTAAVTLICLITYVAWIRTAKRKSSLVLSGLASVGMLATFGLTLYPFMLPSQSSPSMSLTLWDACSSQLTLFVMFVMTLIFMPLILAYTSWVYYVLRGPVTRDMLEKELNSY